MLNFDIIQPMCSYQSTVGLQLDRELAALEDRRTTRLHRQVALQRKEHQRQHEKQQASSLSNVDYPDNSMSEENEDSECIGVFSDCASGNPTSISSSTGPKKRAKMCAKAAIGPELASVLDRTRVSNRNAAFILHVAAKTYATGQDPSDMSLSVSSIPRSRSQHRMQAAAEAKASSLSDSPLAVHFDGKLQLLVDKKRMIVLP